MYFFLQALPAADFQTVLYFTTVAFTTVGFGDIVMGPDWRLLSAFTAANGFILFGWSTAFIFEIIAQIYRREASALQK